MTNFRINFSNPWFLLLLIPAALFTLIPYFRIPKKYRRTRNRIASIVLHLVVMVLAVSVLSGMTFAYDIPNTENEVILLVDTSFSGDDSEYDKNSFVEDVINSTDSKYKLGVVTFGYDQVYAVELTNQMNGVYNKYMSAEKPDNSATDIASALIFASEKFSNPESGRIVLISDGIETDSNAKSVIKQIAAKGIKVDTVHFPKEKAEYEVLLTGVTTPDRNIRVGEKLLRVPTDHFLQWVENNTNTVGGKDL